MRSFRIQFDHCDEKLQNHGQIGPSYVCEAPILVIILYFLIIMVESSSETSHSSFDSTYGERAVLYSFEVDDNGEQL